MIDSDESSYCSLDSSPQISTKTFRNLTYCTTKKDAHLIRQPPIPAKQYILTTIGCVFVLAIIFLASGN
ncbi:unnamed protein product [Caenorhabditis nigoni]